MICIDKSLCVPRHTAISNNANDNSPPTQGGFLKGPGEQEVPPPEKTPHAEWGRKPGQGCAFPLQWHGEDEPGLPNWSHRALQ